MAFVPLADLVRFLDDYLRIREIGDYSEAFNGLQLTNEGKVGRVGAAVDACGYTVDRAAEKGIDLLLVHHGLFWGGVHPMVGGRYRLWKRAMEAGVAVYGAHLPLDAHPQVGNNVLLGRAMGLEEGEPAFPSKGTCIGRKVGAWMLRDELVNRLERAVQGPVRLCPGGSEWVEHVGIVTGGAGAEVREAATAGVGTFITGEGPHWTYTLAEELGVNILYGGHYATETFGVKALAAHLGGTFGLPWEFIDHPTGL